MGPRRCRTSRRRAPNDSGAPGRTHIVTGTSSEVNPPICARLRRRKREFDMANSKSDCRGSDRTDAGVWFASIVVRWQVRAAVIFARRRTGAIWLEYAQQQRLCSGAYNASCSGAALVARRVLGACLCLPILSTRFTTHARATAPAGHAHTEVAARCCLKCTLQPCGLQGDRTRRTAGLANPPVPRGAVDAEACGIDCC